MKRKIILLLGIALAAILMGRDIAAQTFSISEIDATKFPQLRAGFVALDSKEKSYTDLTKADFDVRENGASMNASVIVECLDTLIDPDVSLALVLDQSGSMNFVNEQGERRWSWVYEGVTKFVENVKITDSTFIGTITFGANTIINCPFTQDKQAILDSLDQVIISGATDYDAPFLDDPGGVISFLQQRPPSIRRVAVFLTDGEPREEPHTDSIIAELHKANIQVYAITLAMPMHSDLKTICEATGGKSYAVYTKEELHEIYTYIALDIQKKQFCNLYWDAPFGCTDLSRMREVEIKFLRHNVNVRRPYNAPQSSIAEVEVSESIIAFGDPNINSSVEKDVTIKPLSTDFDVNDIQIQPPTFFEIVDWDVNGNGGPPPFTIAQDEERTLKIRFTQGPAKNFRQATLIPDGGPCPPLVTLVGGLSQILIVNPSEGELFSTCDTIDIIWAGIEPTVPVNLSYSTDGGTTWEPIVQNATGLRYKWLPPSPSTEYKLRGLVAPQSSYMWAKGTGSDLDDAGKSIAVQDDDLYMYVAGHFEKVVDFDNVTLSSAGGKDAFLAKYDTDGNVIWSKRIGGAGVDSATSVAVDPSNNAYVAGTCYNGAQFGSMYPTMAISGVPYAFVAKYPPAGTSPSVIIIGASNINNTGKAWINRIRYENGKIYCEGQYTGAIECFGTVLPYETNPSYFTAIINENFSPPIQLQRGRMTFNNWSNNRDVDSDGNDYFTNGFANTIKLGSHTLNSAGKRDIYVAKYGGVPGSEFITGEFSIQAPILDFTVESVDFGDCTLQANKDSVFSSILCNTGDLPVEISHSDFSGTYPDDFLLISNLNSLIIQPGDCIPVEILFTPRGIGYRNAQFEVSGTCAEQVILQLEGNGICSGEPMAVVDMGKVNLNLSKDSLLTCSIKNTNNSPIEISPVIEGTDAADFQLIPQRTAYVMAAGECYEITVRFTPTAPGQRTATINYQLPDGCEEVYTDLLGEGVDADISVSPADWKERRILMVNDSAVVVTNSSTLAANITEIYLETTAADGEFTVTPPTLPYLLPAGESLEIPVTFSAPDEITYSNAVMVKIEALPTPLRAPLTGIGVLPKIKAYFHCDTLISPGESATVQLELENSSLNAPLYIEKIDFQVPTNDYDWVTGMPEDFSLAIGETRFFDLTYTPQTSGIRTVNLVISCDAKPGPGPDLLRDTTVAAQCESLGITAPEDHDFQSVFQCNSNPDTIRLSNNSWQTEIEVVDYYFTGADSVAFNLLPPRSFVIQPYNYKDVIIEFVPLEEKVYNATIHFVTDFGVETSIDLTGTGETINFMTNKLEIQSTPGTNQKVTVGAKINKLATDVVEEMTLHLKYDPTMLEYFPGSLINKAGNKWTWDNPIVTEPGTVEIHGEGVLETPFDDNLFEMELSVFLSGFKQTDVILQPIFTTCTTADQIGTTIVLSDICFLDGRLVIANGQTFSMMLPEPNPASDNTKLQFTIPLNCAAKIEIYNSLGELVGTALDERVKPGSYEIFLDLSRNNSGVYLLRLQAGPFTETKTLIISK